MASIIAQRSDEISYRPVMTALPATPERVILAEATFQTSPSVQRFT